MKNEGATPDLNPVAKLFGNAPRGLDAALAEMETFIREQIGDHKYYAFDGATRARRVEFVGK